jgi:purine-binding chemotaxis protein CheW
MQRYRHDPSKNLVGFVVGDVEYAVAIARVKEIANPLPIVPMPHAPRSVVGVAHYRGDVVSVIDLRIRFGLQAVPTTRKTKWIVLDTGTEGDAGSSLHAGLSRAPEATAPLPGRLLALVVDAVTDVFGTGNVDLRPAPALGSGDDARGIAGVTTHSDGLVFVLDMGRLRHLADTPGKGSGGALSSPPERGQDSGENPSSPTPRGLPARAAS